MSDFSKHLFVWVVTTAILFLIGWGAVSFIWIDEAAIPLTTHGSRAWLVVCGLVTWLLMQTEGYKK